MPNALSETFFHLLKESNKRYEKKSEALHAIDFLNQLNLKLSFRKKRLVLRNLQGKENYLTLREQELLYYLLRGKTQSQVSSALKISTRTVQYHWQNIRKRFRILTIDQLVQNWRVEPTFL